MKALVGRKVESLVEEGIEGVVIDASMIRGGGTLLLVETPEGEFHEIRATHVRAKIEQEAAETYESPPAVFLNLLGAACEFLEMWDRGASGRKSIGRIREATEKARNYLRNSRGKQSVPMSFASMRIDGL